MLLKMKVTVLPLLMACTLVFHGSTMETKQKKTSGAVVDHIPTHLNHPHAAFVDRETRSVTTVKSTFGSNARNLIRKLFLLKNRIPVFEGAKLVKRQGGTRYWEKLGGKVQFEKDLATMYLRRSANDVDAIESFNGMGGAGMPYSLRIESKTPQGQQTVEVITYLRNWGELNGANVVKIGNTGYH